jgi:O-antigen/teichoic acid export membrane protein
MLHVPLANLVRRQRGRLNNLAVLLVANVFTAGVGFVTTVTIANTLGAARFGELAYALAIGGILAVNVRFGMDRSLIRDLAHYPERFNETLAASLLARGLLLVLSLGGLAVLAALPIAGLELSWGMLLVIAATALGPLQIANVFDIWEVQGRHALYGCLERGLYFALVWAVVLAAPERLGLAWIGLALLAATLLYLFVQYRYAWNRLKPTLRAIPSRRLARTAAGLVADNTWLWLASVGVLGMYALNKVILKHFAGFADLGVYAASFQLISVALLVLKNMARIGRPILARHTSPRAANPAAAVRFLGLYLAAGIVAVGLIALPAIAVPQWILRALFTAEYAAGYWVLRLMGVYLLFRVFDTVLGQYVIMLRMDSVFFGASVAAGLTGLAASLILIPPLAAVGAALALLAGEIIFALIYLLMTLVHITRLSAAQRQDDNHEDMHNQRGHRDQDECSRAFACRGVSNDTCLRNCSTLGPVSSPPGSRL